MANVILVHGLGGSPDENWFPWIKEKLESAGVRVIAPSFPNANHPKLDEWLSELHRHNKEIDENTILIGHSLGCALILSALELRSRPVKAVFFVAGFDRLLGSVEVSPLIRSFVDKPFDWERIRQNSGMFYVIHSNNDPYISFDLALQFALNLGVEVTLVKGAGHFNERSNYHKFPRLLVMVKKEL